MTIECVGVIGGKMPQGIYLQLLVVPGLFTTPCLGLEMHHKVRILFDQSLNGFSSNRERLHATKSVFMVRVGLTGIQVSIW